MYGAHIGPPPAPAPAAAPPTRTVRRAQAADALGELDAALIQFLRFWQRPAVRRWFEEHAPPSDACVFRTLRAVADAGGTAGVGDVAQWLELDASTASRFVERAVALGHLEREVSPTDRRRVVLRLSPAGEEHLRQVSAARAALFRELTTGWDPGEVAALAALLERLNASSRRFEARR